MYNPINLLKAVLMLSLILAIGVQTVNAFSNNISSAAPGECVSLDVLFIIDQSDSMSGFAGSRPSDPFEERKYAVDAAIDQLSDIALDRCPDTKHRLAVISYGTNSRVDLKWSNIDPDSFEDATTLRKILKSYIKADRMGYTNHLEAFKKALRVFSDLPIDSQNIRKKVVIFITDGVPDLPDDDPARSAYAIPGGEMDMVAYARDLKSFIDRNFPFSQRLLQYEYCLSDLRNRYGGKLENAPPEEVNKCIKQNPVDIDDYQQSTYIWTLFLASPYSYPASLVSVYEQIAQEHGGALIELRKNLNEIPTTFREILSNLSGARASLLNCGKFAVNPYLKRAILNIYKIDPELKVTLSYVSIDGKERSVTGGQPSSPQGFDIQEYGADGPNERYVFRDPYPGLWNLTADDCTGLNVYYEEVHMSAEYQMGSQSLPQYEIPPYYDEADPFYLSISVRGEDGSIVTPAEHPRFAINVKVQVSQPDGRVIEHQMVWDNDQKIFRSKEPLQVPVPGIYRVNVMGTTYIHEGSPAPLSNDSYTEVFSVEKELFRIRDSEISVFPVTSFQIRIISPENGSDLSPIHKTFWESGWRLPLLVNPIKVRVQILDKQGKVLEEDPAQLVTQPNSAFIARILGGPQITLSPDPTSKGEYVGEFSGYETEGRGVITVELADDIYSSRYRPSNRTDQVEFYRTDSLLHRQSFYVLLSYVLLGLIGLSVVLWGLSLRSPLKGDVVVLMGTYEITSFSLSTARQKCCRSRKVIPARVLSKYPEIGLRKIEVRWQARRAGKSAAMETGGSDYFSPLAGSSAERGITVKVWPTKGRSYQLDLANGVPVPLHGENMVYLKYVS